MTKKRQLLAKRVTKDVAKLRKDLRKAKAVVKPKAKKAKRTWLGHGIRALGAVGSAWTGIPAIEEWAGRAARGLGQGRYHVQGPGGSTAFPPTFAADYDQGYTITHREYLTDFNSSVDFSSQTYYLNPGLKQTFPWLSQIAANFEEYTIDKCMFACKTNSGWSVGTTNTALGVWGCVTQYDASDPDFGSKRECENYMGCSTAVPAENVLHAVECKPSANVLKKRYVRSSALGANEDIKFYDLGKTTIFSQGAQASATIGEIWVTYQVTFYKPKLPAGGSTAVSDAYYQQTGATNANPLTTANLLPKGNLGTYVQGSTSSIIFPSWMPEGIYQVLIMWTGGSGTTAQSGLSYSGGISAANYYAGGNVQNIPLGVGTAAAMGRAFTVLKKGSVQGSVTLNSGWTLPSSSALFIVITAVDPTAYSARAEQPRISIDELTLLRKLLKNYTLKEEMTSRSKNNVTPDNVNNPRDNWSEMSEPRIVRQNAKHQHFDSDLEVIGAY